MANCECIEIIEERKQMKNVYFHKLNYSPHHSIVNCIHHFYAILITTIETRVHKDVVAVVVQESRWIRDFLCPLKIRIHFRNA